jgi:hypothetical protein
MEDGMVDQLPFMPEDVDEEEALISPLEHLHRCSIPRCIQKSG